MSHSINSWSASHETNESNIPWASHENPIETTIEPPVFSCDPPWAPLAVVAAHAWRPGKTREMAGILWGIQWGSNGNKMGCNGISWLFNGKSWDRMVDNIGSYRIFFGIQWFFSWDITEYNGISWIAWVVMEIYLMNITDHFMEWGYHVWKFQWRFCGHLLRPKCIEYHEDMMKIYS